MPKLVVRWTLALACLLAACAAPPIATPSPAVNTAAPVSSTPNAPSPQPATATPRPTTLVELEPTEPRSGSQPTPTAVVPTATPFPTPLPPPTVVPHPLALSSANVGMIEELARLGNGRAKSVAWAPDGQTLIVASGSTIDLYDSETLAKVSSLPTGASLIAVHPNGHLLATPTRDGVEIWSLDQAAVYQRWNSQLVAITDLAFSPDGRWLAAVGYDALGRDDSQHGLEVWAVDTGQSRYAVSTGYLPYDVDFSPDSTHLAVATYYGAPVFDVETGQVTIRLNSEGDSVAFTPDGQSVLAARSIWIDWFDLATGQLQAELQDVTEFVLSPDGKRMLAYRGVVGSQPVAAGERWILPSGQQIHLHPLHGTSAAFRPDGAMFAVINGDVELYQLDEDEPFGRLAYTTPALAVEFLPSSPGSIELRLLGG